jgi:transposase
VSRDWRDERIAEQDRRIAELEAENRELRALVAKLEKRIADLEARLGQNSSNSNRPPSSDTPEQRRDRDKKKSTGRKKGGQPGHKPHSRQMLPPEKVTRVEDHFPSECKMCGTALPRVEDPDPLRKQVIDVPEIKPDVTEHRCHASDCPECGHRNRARLPEGTPQSIFGPRLLALTALLTGTFQLGRRQAVALLSELLSVSVSLGALSEAEQRASEAIAPAVDEARQFVMAQPVRHFDATSWSRQGLSRTLWTITTTTVAVFAITADATRDTVRGLLGKVRGILVSDRATAFDFWTMKLRQVCWSHLIRKFEGFVERGGSGSKIAGDLHGTSQLMFHYWHRVRDGTMSRQQFRRWMENVRERIEWLLQRGAALGCRGLSGCCKNILEHREALWTFVDREGVDPTNNLAERDLRPGVLWRKRSYGSQSDRGELYAERMLTVTHTLRKQGRPILPFLHQACANRLYANPPPSLLPSF